MLMAKYGSVYYLYLTICFWEAIASPFPAVPNSGTDEKDAVGKFNGERGSLPLTYEGHPIEELPFELRTNKYFNFDQTSEPIDELYGPPNVEKKATRNFLRFGRGPSKNFLRFGKADFGLGLDGEEMEENVLNKRAGSRNFLRFGRGQMKNFIRYGRGPDRNFIRFGRSVSKDLGKCKDCKDVNDPANSSNTKKSSNVNKSRNKRSIPAFYDDLVFMAPTPLSWIESLGNLGPNPAGTSANGQGGLVTANGQKRAHGRSSFLRYGRDPLDLHFLRFGKRGVPSGSTELDGEDGFPREARMNKNFLRFG